MTEPETLIAALSEASLTVAVAESCTAGLVSDLLAQVPGASRVFWGSFVSYSVAAKRAMLGLDAARILRYGVVSAETARDMAQGALAQSGADMAVAVTGLAGPAGDGSATLVGTVWIGTAFREGCVNALMFHYAGARNDVRLAAAHDAIHTLLEAYGAGATPLTHQPSWSKRGH
ncbi:MAG: CinA family protein [Treponema sp.]|nr:CinA family protein [Treponema sp.]